MCKKKTVCKVGNPFQPTLDFIAGMNQPKKKRFFSSEPTRLMDAVYWNISNLFPDKKEYDFYEALEVRCFLRVICHMYALEIIWGEREASDLSVENISSICNLYIDNKIEQLLNVFRVHIRAHQDNCEVDAGMFHVRLLIDSQYGLRKRYINILKDYLLELSEYTA